MRSKLEKLFREDYDKLVRRISYRVGGIPNAEDVVMEAFARALAYHKTYREKRGTFEQWFNTIINNSTRDFKKAERNNGMGLGDDELTDEMDMSMFRGQLLDAVQEWLDGRDDEKSFALYLYLVMGHTAKEVAAVTNLAAQTIRLEAMKFREEFRDRYGENMCS